MNTDTDKLGGGWLFIIGAILALLLAGGALGYWFDGIDPTPSNAKMYNDAHVYEQTFFSHVLGRKVRVMRVQPECLDAGWRTANVDELRRVFEYPPQSVFGHIIVCETMISGEFGMARVYCVRYVNSHAVEFEAVLQKEVLDNPSKYHMLVIQDELQDKLQGRVVSQ